MSAERASGAGWAVFERGHPRVATVSPTRRAALVNGLVVIFGQVPLNDWSDDRIEEEWTHQTGLKTSDWRFEIAPVVIVPAGDRS